MKIQESAENYLEMILILENGGNFVKSVDIAKAMDFSKPSVSRAMNLLKENGFITIEKHGLIRLTDNGREVAESVYDRHMFLTEFLTALGVDKVTAAADACRIEHVISQESFEKLKEHIKEM
jgi:Mn-dependent DtxR family transcriptional regulator